jgi:hypothetical protein
LTFALFVHFIYVLLYDLYLPQISRTHAYAPYRHILYSQPWLGITYLW